MKKEPSPICRKLRLLHNAFKEERNRQLLRYELTSSQIDILAFLYFNEEKEIYQREIERWLHLKNPTVTGILNRLEEKSFIKRITNPEDRRFRKIELTEKSRTVLQEIGEEIDTRDRKLYSCMTEDEQILLEQLLDRLLENLKESEEKEC